MLLDRLIQFTYACVRVCIRAMNAMRLCYSIDAHEHTFKQNSLPVGAKLTRGVYVNLMWNTFVRLPVYVHYL